MIQHAIDFVVPWVDGADPVWQAKKKAYTGDEIRDGNTQARYRDWGTLKYWFRGIEKYAPWVRYIHFVTDDQLPEWLNTQHPKLKWVKHTDFIPAEYLPTFSVNPIELNLHRIQGLAEHFVYFNDDVFLIDETRPEDFFVEGLPCDQPVLDALFPDGLFSHILLNNAHLINRHFSVRESIRSNLPKWISHQTVPGLIKLAVYGRCSRISNCKNRHIHLSFLKTTFDDVWDKEYAVLHQTCCSRLRSTEDVSAYCMRDWQLLSGMFHPRKPIGKCFQTAGMACSGEAMDYLRSQRGRVICLNDTEDEQNFELHKQMILDVFEKLLPEKSSFEW